MGLRNASYRKELIQPKDMKATAPADRRGKRGERVARLSSVVDCNYQAPSYFDLSGGHCDNVPDPSFRNIVAMTTAKIEIGRRLIIAVDNRGQTRFLFLSWRQRRSRLRLARL